MLAVYEVTKKSACMNLEDKRGINESINGMCGMLVTPYLQANAPIRPHYNGQHLLRAHDVVKG